MAVGLRGRMSRLERQAAGLYQTLILPDGQQIRYTHEEMMSAVIAAMHHQEYRLLPYIRQLDTTQGMPGLIRQLEESRAREQV
jgi:hypothetical protein